MNNIGRTNPNDGDFGELDPMVGGGSGSGSQANVSDEVMADIDNLFGSGDLDASAGGGNNGITPGGGDNIPGTPQGPAQPDLSGMSPEQLAAHFQSLYDKTNAWKQKVEPKLSELESVAEFLHQVYEDPEVKQAFLAELAPDLVKPQDPFQALQEQLVKEFGADFTPDDEEANKPLTKSWRYLKRVDELYRELQTKGNKGIPKSLKELREQRERDRQAQMQATLQEKQEIMRENNWTEADWVDFTQWGNKLRLKHLAKFKSGLQKRGGKAPSLVNQFGGTPMQANQLKTQLDYFFG